MQPEALVRRRGGGRWHGGEEAGGKHGPRDHLDQKLSTFSAVYVLQVARLDLLCSQKGAECNTCIKHERVLDHMEKLRQGRSTRPSGSGCRASSYDTSTAGNFMYALYIYLLSAKGLHGGRKGLHGGENNLIYIICCQPMIYNHM